MALVLGMIPQLDFFLLGSCNTAPSSSTCRPSFGSPSLSVCKPWKVLAGRPIEAAENRDLCLRRCGCFWEGNEGDNETQHHVLATDLPQFASEREEAKAIVIQFLKTLGLSSTLSARITKKAVQFVAHLVTLLHIRYRLRYLTGRELTTAEIRNTLLPYLEALSAEHGNGLADVLVYFPNPPPPKEYHRKGVLPNAKTWFPKSVQKQGLTVNGNFRPSVSYALSLGLSLDQVQAITNRFPCLLFYSPERSIIPVVDYLLALGIPKLGIQKIFLKRPQIFGCSLDENLKPTVAYLESVGVEKSQWPRILVNFPALLTYGKENLQETVAFLSGVGLSAVDVGWIITRFPQVVSYSVEGKLSSTVEFLKSIGLTDISSLVRRSPQVLGYSVEGNIKPTVRFLIELGFDQKDVITMIRRFPPVLGLAIDNNIKRKWDYFSLTGWPKRYIVAFPQYFGYSLEGRIKPRFKVVLKYGLCWTPSRILSLSDTEFQKSLERELEQDGEAFIVRPGSHVTSSARMLCENG